LTLILCTAVKVAENAVVGTIISIDVSMRNDTFAFERTIFALAIRRRFSRASQADPKRTPQN
jgi:hypothetical protein